jgi:hypothetical protein
MSSPNYKFPGEKLLRDDIILIKNSGVNEGHEIGLLSFVN